MALPFVIVEGVIFIADTNGNIVDIVTGEANKKRLATSGTLVGGNSPFLAAHTKLINGDVKLLTDATVTVEELLGFDNTASVSFLLSGTVTAGDTVTVKIGPVGSSDDVLYTITAADAAAPNPLDSVAQNIVTALTADSTFKLRWSSKNLFNRVYIVSKFISERGEEKDTGPTFDVVTTGTITVQESFTEIARRSKLVLGVPDRKDPRFVRLGILGEVSSLVKAENPIFITVRKTLTSQDETVFIDANFSDLLDPDEISLSIDEIQSAFISNIGIGDDQPAEFMIYKGFFRDRLDSFVGDGSTTKFLLDFNAVILNSHLEVKKDSVVQVLGGNGPTGYDATNDHSDLSDLFQRKCEIEFNTAPANGAAIDVTYDAVRRRTGLFVVKSGSQTFDYGAPVKLIKDDNHFLIVTIANKTSSAGIVIANINGFFESV